MSNKATIMQEEWLRSATAWQRRPRESARRAGPEALEYLEKYLNNAKKNITAAEAFNTAIGEGFAEHCRPQRLSKGVLYVQCDSGAYLHIMRTREAELVEETNAICETAKIKTIRFSIRK